MPGLTPPPEGNVDKGPALIIASCITIFIIVLFVILRFAVRVWITKAIGWDDWTILFAVVRHTLDLKEVAAGSDLVQVGNVIGTALDFLQVHNGLGRPEYFLTEHQVREVVKVSYGQWMQT